MKVVLFCGGLGTRIREYSENIPKPMIPIGSQPILWHVMQYYSQYGHRDFVLCLGYKANVIKDYFLNYQASTATAIASCRISASKVEILGEQPPDWRVTLVDTGVWRNIGERLMAVKHLVAGRGDLSRQLQRRPDRCAAAGHDRASSRRAERSAASSPFVRRSISIWPNSTATDTVERFRSNQESEIWINGGYFIFRKEIFDYIRDGEELVLEPFNRLIEDGQLIAYKYEGFWRAMDTLRDRQVLEEMVERGEMPWRPHGRSSTSDVARHEGAAARRSPATACRSSAWAPIPTISRSAPAQRC